MSLVNPLVPNSSFVSHNLGKQNKHLGGPLLIYRTSHLRCSASTNVISHQPPQRNSANYQPTLWTYDFLQSLNNDYADVKCKDTVTKLREDVRRVIKDENRAGLFTKLEQIDDIQRLGLSYLFEKEIAETLHRFVSLERCHGTTNKSLHEAALSFRLLREHGYDVSQDIFESFREDNGDFKACLTEDVKGMLSLYEASFLGFEGEHILDEANAFTSMHLKQVKEDILNKTLLEEVSHALELSIHHRIQRLEARWYIEAYSKREQTQCCSKELNWILTWCSQHCKGISKICQGMFITLKMGKVNN